MTLISCSIFNTNSENYSNRITILTEQLEKLGKLILEDDVSNPEISKWSVYKQVEHIVLANNGICEMIEKGEKPSEEISRSWLSYLTFTFGYIPRGKAEAPSYVCLLYTSRCV